MPLRPFTPTVSGIRPTHELIELWFSGNKTIRIFTAQFRSIIAESNGTVVVMLVHHDPTKLGAYGVFASWEEFEAHLFQFMSPPTEEQLSTPNYPTGVSPAEDLVVYLAARAQESTQMARTELQRREYEIYEQLMG